MRVGSRFVVVLSVMACACVPGIPPLPSDGGPEWLELKTEHVTLWTDASAKHARVLVRELEWRRQMVLAVMRRAALNSTAGKTPIVAVALRDWLEAGEYGANLAWSANSVMGQPGVLLCADDKRRNYSVNHELAHAMTDYAPFWLDEGTASYFEEIEFTPDGTSVVVGAVPSWVRRYLTTGLLLLTPVADVLGCVERRCMDSGATATSWAMFSYLANHHPEALDRYLVRYAELSRDATPRAWYEARFDTSARLAQARQRALELERGRAAQAWREVFPELAPDELDGKLRDWLFKGHVPIFKIAARRAQVAVTERTLGEADVLAIRGWLALQFTDDMESGRANIEAALARDRTNLLARLVHAKVTHAIALDDARATVAAHPDDWRALRLVEFALHGTAEGAQVVAQICAMSSNTAPECRAPRRPPAVSGD